MTSRALRGGLLAAFLWAQASLASAQFEQPLRSVGPAPSSLVAPDGADAVVLNPGALALGPAYSASFIHVEAAEGDRLDTQGDAAAIGARLPYGLALGAQIERVRPTQGSGAARRAGVMLTTAFRASKTLGLGLTYRFLGSRDGAVGGARALDLGASYRPSPRLGFSLTGRNLLGPLDLASSSVRLPASFLVAAAFRPFGTDAFTVEAAFAADSESHYGVRAFGEVSIPYIGRAHAVVEVNDVTGDRTDVRALAGLSLDWGGSSVEGGVLVGDGIGRTPAWYSAIRLSSERGFGIPEPKIVLEVDARGTLDPRRLLSVLAQLDAARSDDRVKGVLLELEDSDLGVATAQELRLAIHALRGSGRVVVCQLPTATGSEAYACSAATHTMLDPAGDVRLLGPSADVLSLGDVLHRAGIRADFVRIGRYKSAPEQFMRGEMSGPAREQRETLLDDVARRLRSDFASDQGLSDERAARLIDDGPYTPEDAVHAGLVSALVDSEARGEFLRRAFGPGVRLRSSLPPRPGRRFGVAPRVGVVVLDGSLTDGENQDVPLLEIHTTGARTAVAAIERMARDSSIAAIVLRVESPGGSASASDRIWRAVRRARRDKPVIASMGSVAASGGYYVASAADEIVADPSTVTGSIGIFYGKVDFAQLAERLGVGVEQIARGRHAGATSLFRPFTDDEREALRAQITYFYQLFVRRVATGRDMTPAQVDALGQGRIYSGDRALRAHLVDRLGGFVTAVARARELADLPGDAEMVFAPSRPHGLMGYLLGSGGDSASVGTPLSGVLSGLGSIAAGLDGLDGMRPQARLPFVLTPP